MDGQVHSLAGLGLVARGVLNRVPGVAWTTTVVTSTVETTTNVTTTDVTTTANVPVSGLAFAHPPHNFVLSPEAAAHHE